MKRLSIATAQGKASEAKDEVIKALPLACFNEGAAVVFLEELRWGNDLCCPNCGSVNVYQMRDRKSGEREKHYRWRCRDCKTAEQKGDQFSVRTGTVMEESRIPLRHWCWAFWQLCSSRKGMSAKQIQRQTGLSYKSALFLLHRVRFGMVDMEGVKLSGTVEADETYVGGKPRRGSGVKSKQGRGTKKTPVVGMVERGGKVRTQVARMSRPRP